MEIIREKIIGKEYNYPSYSTNENGILSITDAVLENIGLYVRSNKIIYNHNLMQIEGTQILVAVAVIVVVVAIALIPVTGGTSVVLLIA